MNKSALNDNKTFIRKSFRIYPTDEQIASLNQEIGNQRFVWNHFLAENMKRYESEKKFMFMKECSSELTLLKREEGFEWLSLGARECLTQTLMDLDKAIKHSFKSQANRKGFPRFKKKSNGGSCRFQSFSFVNGKLRLPKIDTHISIVNGGYELPHNSKLSTVIKRPSGRWFASFVVPYDVPGKIPFADCENTVGVDLNSNDIVVTSHGEKVENQKHIRSSEKRLKRLQRKLSRCEKGSSNQKKARVRLAKLHERVANQRKDFVEKLTLDIVKHNDVICVEDLNVKAMQQWNGRMVQSAPFGMVRKTLEWKANKLGKHLVAIDRFDPSSKMCHVCGQIHEMPPNKRWMSCVCGNEMHRDLNAAMNIQQMGLQKIGSLRPKFTPPETLSLQNRNVQWGPLKEEAP